MKQDKIINVLKNWFDEKEYKEEDKTKLDEEEIVGYIEPANVLLIYPKTKEFKDLIERNFDVGNSNKEIPKLDYKVSNFEEAKDEMVSTYSMQYLSEIFKLCENYEKVKFKLKNNYPLWVETIDFVCILAPRVETDEE